MKRFAAIALLAGSLAACTTTGSQVTDRRAPQKIELPPMKSFAGYKPAPVRESNRQIAVDFLELSFQMESGRELERFTRFEGPVRIAVVGQAPSTLTRDLDQLVGRLKREAGLDIKRVSEPTQANIVVEALPQRELQRYVPQAACFVVPNAASWNEFLKKRRSKELDWTRLQVRTQAAIFIPNNVSPQEIRDCLHEEIAQALGPLNDLYRLQNSVFNDDNFHSVLTSYDMLLLRTTYDPVLQIGMSRDDVASRLPSILARLNPSGISGPPAGDPKPNREWIKSIEKALGPGTGARRRQSSAIQALNIAQSVGFPDGRLPFSFYALGRLSLGADAELSLASFLQAGGIYQSMPGSDLQQAHVAMQITAFALTTGQGETALRLVDSALPSVRQSENAALLATLLMMKAEALDLMGRDAEAQAVRLDSLGWARYGIGSDDWVRERLSEVAALPPPNRGN